MISTIGIENFKAFGKYTEIQLSNLTLVSGLNSSGKSTIYQSLLLLAQSENKFCVDIYKNRIPTLEINGELISFGTSEDILNNKQKKYVKFKIVWDDNFFAEFKYELTDLSKENDQTSDSENIFVLSEYKIGSKKQTDIHIIREKGTWTIHANGCLSFGEYEIEKSISDQILKSIIDDDTIDDSDIDLQLEEETPESETYIGHEEFHEQYSSKVCFKEIETVNFFNTSPLDFIIKFSDLKECITPLYRDITDWNAIKSSLQKKKIDHSRILNDEYRSFSPSKVLNR